MGGSVAQWVVQRLSGWFSDSMGGSVGGSTLHRWFSGLAGGSVAQRVVLRFISGSAAQWVV
jgi:hypothetical protein